MIHECIRGECQNHFGGWQGAKYSRNKIQSDLRKTGLVQKKYRASSPWLATLDLGDDGVCYIFESVVSYDDILIIRQTALRQHGLKVACV